MKILDRERAVALSSGIGLILTENEACGLIDVLDGLLKDNSATHCIPSDDDDGPFVTLSMCGHKDDDL